MILVTDAFVNEAAWAGWGLAISISLMVLSGLALSGLKDTEALNNKFGDFLALILLVSFIGILTFGCINAVNSTTNESYLKGHIQKAGYIGVDVGVNGDLKRFTAVIDEKEQECALFETDVETEFKVVCVD